MPEKLIVNCLCNRISVPALDHPQLSYILTELAAEKNTSKSRMPLNLAFIIDSSSSINEEDFEKIKQNICHLIEQLHPGDTFSLIQLGRRVRAIIPAQ